MSGTAPSDNPTGGAPSDRGVEQTSLDSHQHGQAQNLIDEAQLRQEPTDRDIGANKEAADPRGVLQEEAGTKVKSEERNNQGFKVGDEGDMHDLAAGKQP
ncbi:hypothetical protein Daus18300_000274 [Diaporthe australafricana]|uniref:Uncharacterized protein n=1 Tax=Diaporthe australafricana TaxID=127596 RepID=A0ABR3Y4K0_9PEZI